MKIRVMKIEDFEEMYALWEEAGLGVNEFENEKDHTKLMIKINPLSNFVAVEDAKIVGSIFGTFNGRRGWIYHLAVHPNFQKKGLGSLLIKKAEKTLKKMGAKRVLLGVDKSNLEVLKFYKKFGYEKMNDAIFLGKNLGGK